MRLKETIEQFELTEVWNDSCDIQELKYALDYGATGATTNPVIVLQVLKNNMEEYEPRILEMIKEYPHETEDELAWRVIGELGTKAGKYLEPVFEKTGGKQGRISFQVNAKYYKSTEKIVEHALALNALIPNAQIKAPTSLEGIKAFEELTYQGVSINATVCFTVAQAIAVAKAVERGLDRREKEGLSNDFMSPVCTIMSGRVDDALKVYIEKENIILDPEIYEWAGVAVGKKVHEIYKERGYRTKLLIAAYRNHYHWSSFIGGNVILTIPYKWQKRYNESSVLVENNIEKKINPKYLKQLMTLKPFVEAYEEDGLSEEAFCEYPAFKSTMRQFLGGYDELVSIIRHLMLK